MDTRGACKSDGEVQATYGSEVSGVDRGRGKDMRREKQQQGDREGHASRDHDKRPAQKERKTGQRKKRTESKTVAGRINPI
jgi:hypothetical protein